MLAPKGMKGREAGHIAYFAIDSAVSYSKLTLLASSSHHSKVAEYPIDFRLEKEIELSLQSRFSFLMLTEIFQTILSMTFPYKK